MHVVVLVHERDATVVSHLNDARDVPAWYDVTTERMFCANCVHRTGRGRRAKQRVLLRGCVPVGRQLRVHMQKAIPARASMHCDASNRGFPPPPLLVVGRSELPIGVR